MEKKSTASITSESLASQFPNRFELVNHAIKMAERLLHQRENRFEGKTFNTATQVINDLATGKTSLNDFYSSNEESSTLIMEEEPVYLFGAEDLIEIDDEDVEEDSEEE